MHLEARTNKFVPLKIIQMWTCRRPARRLPTHNCLLLPSFHLLSPSWHDNALLRGIGGKFEFRERGRSHYQEEQMPRHLIWCCDFLSQSQKQLIWIESNCLSVHFDQNSSTQGSQPPFCMYICRDLLVTQNWILKDVNSFLVFFYQSGPISLHHCIQLAAGAWLSWIKFMAVGRGGGGRRGGRPACPCSYVLRTRWRNQRGRLKEAVAYWTYFEHILGSFQAICNGRFVQSDLK